MKKVRAVGAVAVMVLLLSLVAGGSLAQSGGSALAVLGTAFTYQGRLSDGGSPASGTYDLEFKLYDSANGDNQVGSTITVDDQTVSNGLFTVELDFGGAFDGTALWLEIGVRGGSESGAYTTLVPRQTLSATPYARYAAGAPWNGLSGMPNGFSDGVDNDTTYSAGAGLSLSGGTFSVDFAGTGSAATVARSDHDHWGQSWSGSGVGLTLASSDGHGLVVDGGSGISDNGIQINSAGNAGVYVQATGPESSGVHVHSAGGDGIYVWSTDIGDGVHVQSVGDDGLAIWSAGDDGIDIHLASDYGIQIDFAGRDGVQVGEAGSPSTTNSSSADNGFEVEGAEGSGLFVGRADADGVHVQSAGGDGVHATGGSGADQYGGWFQGYSGVYGKGTGTTGYGGHFDSDNRHAVYVEGSGAVADGVHIASAGRDGVSVASAGDYGVYVAAAGLDGVHVEGVSGHGVYASAAIDGVYANTTATDHEWGLYTNDKLYVGTSLASGGPLMLVAQNGGADDLERGDVVAVSGVSAPLGEGEAPLPLVQRAGPNDSAVVGVVYGRFVVEAEVKSARGEKQDPWRTRSDLGPAAPGEYVLIVALGPAQVKVSAPPGGILPGDLLAAAGAGLAAKAEALQVNGVSFYPPGLTLGKAMEPLEGASAGLVWVWVTLR
ncbi:MAG: right-handed parallel beta-helix repeat-containing protein [Anaerolineae bacterium]